MERRQVLKALAAVPLAPLIVQGKAVGAAAKFDPTSRYVIFVDSNMIDCLELAELLTGQFPDGTPLYPVMVPPHRSIDDAIRIYELRDNKVG